MGWLCFFICRFLCLVMDGCGMLLPFALLFCPNPELSLSVCQLPKPDYCLCPSSLPSRDCNLTLHCYHVCWGHDECWSVSVAPLSILPLFQSLLFTLIHPPSHVSIGLSFRWVCVLSRECFVELQLCNL